MQKLGLTKDEVRALLPKVGDELIKTPTVYNTTIGLERPRPQVCIVDYVNREHMWYRVRFVETGMCESYGAYDMLNGGVRFK